jgi:hypothetical protein
MPGPRQMADRRGGADVCGLLRIIARPETVAKVEIIEPLQPGSTAS